ncbi:MAG: hypothetical protein ACI9TY_001533, partial [Alphaproteobacteria bacterium]
LAIGPHRTAPTTTSEPIIIEIDIHFFLIKFDLKFVHVHKCSLFWSLVKVRIYSFLRI